VNYIWTQSSCIFILLSIKTRIETRDDRNGRVAEQEFLSYYPLKQGLKLKKTDCFSWAEATIFILLSIKTRIETIFRRLTSYLPRIFLSYYPLKQGLKPDHHPQKKDSKQKFLSYYPLKQGLKLPASILNGFEPTIFILLSIKTRIETAAIAYKTFTTALFLSYYPLKQGLKHASSQTMSNKRIEFLSYYPLKQGLKRILPYLSTMRCAIFILLSIKTRIETISLCVSLCVSLWFLSYYPLKQGLKHLS